MGVLFIHYLIVFLIFLAIDAVWLSTAGPTFYRNEIGDLLLQQPNFVVACAFYALYAAGLLYFVVEPNINRTTIVPAVLAGGFFGLVAYATYDMTNLATMKGFTWRVAVVDMVWGAVLSASVTFVSLHVIRRFVVQGGQII